MSNVTLAEQWKGIGKSWGNLFHLLAQLAIGAVVVMVAWNYVMPTVFGLIHINFWMALCLVILSRHLIQSRQTRTEVTEVVE